MAVLDISHKRARPALKQGAPAVLQGKVFTQSVSGRFRRLKWQIMALCLAVYYLLPFLRWDRGPGQPDQAVMFDIERIRFYFFFVELWHTDLILLTGALVLATIVLVLVNALVGRAWCGFACPQTVWSDLFMLVERRIEGDRRARLRDEGAPLTASRLLRKGLKHGAWILIAMGTGGAFVFYFADAHALLPALVTGQASVTAYIAVATLTATTYTLAGHAREQVCTWMCPWPRLQGAIWDPEALTVNYRDYRGEARASLKKAQQLRATGGTAGDCIDCGQCVTVCPMGIDIREGPNFACINCGLCVDACDGVMAKVARPRGLIDFDSWRNIERGRVGDRPRRRLMRPMTIGLTIAALVLSGLMIGSIATRADYQLFVSRDNNPIAVRLSDGRWRNAYTVRVTNLTLEERAVRLGVSGFPGAEVALAGGAESIDAPIILAPGQRRELRLLISGETTQQHGIAITATDSDTGAVRMTRDYFVIPGAQ